MINKDHLDIFENSFEPEYCEYEEDDDYYSKTLPTFKELDEIMLNLYKVDILKKYTGR